MEQYLDFAARHWYLFAAVAVIIGLLIGTEFTRFTRGVAALTPPQALRLINDQDTLILDVSDSSEYKAGHIPEARHIPHQELAQRFKEILKFKDKPVIVYCRSGNRSGPAGARLKKEGFAQVHVLNGGLAAWQSANLPISKK
ncbi:MAG: rhodanese-like domain-containing protein [Gammaproteobacteria bacterium]